MKLTKPSKGIVTLRRDIKLISLRDDKKGFNGIVGLKEKTRIADSVNLNVLNR